MNIRLIIINKKKKEKWGANPRNPKLIYKYRAFFPKRANQVVIYLPRERRRREKQKKRKERTRRRSDWRRWMNI